MFDINTSSAPINISTLFSKIISVHSYGTRSSTSEHFYIKKSALNVQSKAFSRVGVKSGMEYQLVSKTHPRTLLKIPLEQD